MFQRASDWDYLERDRQQKIGMKFGIISVAYGS
jgi:hypothetical protein